MSRVLVVDDDRAIRELLSCALEYEDYSVATLHDGSQVVATLEAAVEPYVVLMDLMMPRMDGWAVCRALANRPDLLERHPLVLMSAGSQQESEIPKEACAFIHKPFDLEVLYRLVASLAHAPLEAPVAVAACANVA